MSLELLARLGRSRFPLVVTRMRDVDSVRLLKAAQLITASIPAGRLNPPSAEQGEAVVFGITELGELALKQAKAPAEAPLRRGLRPLDDD